MRQLPAGLNRAWLIIIGVVLLLVGAAAALIGTGSAQRLLATTGLRAPQPDSTVIHDGAATFFGATAVVVGVGVVGVLLGVLGLVWLLAQIPRTNPARPFRLQDQADGGLTVCRPDVLTRAVEADLEELPGVTGASAVLRGTATRPELTVRVTAHDRADLPDLVQRIQHDTAGDLAQAMEAPLHRLAVQLDLTRTRRTADTVTL